MHFDLPEPLGRVAVGICMGERIVISEGYRTYDIWQT